MATVVDFGFLTNYLSDTAIFGMGFLIPLALTVAALFLITRNTGHWPFLLFPMVIAIEYTGLTYGTFMYPILASIAGILFVVYSIGPSNAVSILTTVTRQSALPYSEKRKRMLLARDMEYQQFKDNSLDVALASKSRKRKRIGLYNELESAMALREKGEDGLSALERRRIRENLATKESIHGLKTIQKKRDYLGNVAEQWAKEGMDAPTIGLSLSTLSNNMEKQDLRALQAISNKVLEDFRSKKEKKKAEAILKSGKVYQDTNVDKWKEIFGLTPVSEESEAMKRKKKQLKSLMEKM